MVKRRIRLARAILLWGVAGFVALQVALTAAIETRFPEFRDPHYGHKINRLKRRTIDVPTKPLTIVMLGSSRTLGGFKASSLEQPLAEAHGGPVVVFNLGMNAAGPVVQLMNLQRILADGVRPDLLLVEVLPPLLAGQARLQELEEGWIPIDRLALRDLPLVSRYGGPVRPGLYKSWWLSSLVPWYSHRFAILSDVAFYCLPDATRIDGFRGMDNSGCVVQDWEKMTPERRQRALQITHDCFATFLTDFRLGGPACEGMRELLELCRREHIPAALVLMPEGPTFRSWYSADAWAQIQTFLDKLSGDYGIPVISARDWIAEEDFADSHHLLAKGAAVFTQRLGSEGIMPFLWQHYPRVAPERIAGQLYRR